MEASLKMVLKLMVLFVVIVSTTLVGSTQGIDSAPLGHPQPHPHLNEVEPKKPIWSPCCPYIPTCCVTNTIKP